MTYAGQCKDGCACGLGVATSPGRRVYYDHGPNAQCKVYADHGPTGRFDGRNLVCWTRWPPPCRRPTVYGLYDSERGERRDYVVFSDGRCKYNGRC